MRGWLRDETLRRVARNTGLLGSGKVVGAIIHLAGLALTARLLGPLPFGILMLTRSFAQGVSGIAKFQSWQALIRYGAPALRLKERARFADLFAFTIVLDLATGLVAAAAGVLLVPLVGGWFGLEADDLATAQLYCLAIPLMTAASPTGLLRLFDRFDHLSVQSVVTPVVRMVGLGLAWLWGAPFWAVLVAWLVSDLIGDSYLWLAAWRESRRQRVFEGVRPSPRRGFGAHRGIGGFIASTNVSGTLESFWGPVSNLLVGSLLGPAAAGSYRVAQTVIDAVGKPSELATRSFYPEIAKIDHVTDRARFWTLVRRGSAVSGLFGCGVAAILALAGPITIQLVLGPDYASAGTLLRIMALSIIPALLVFPLEAALLALGLAGRVLIARAVAAVGAVAVLFLLVDLVGLPGAGWAIVAGTALMGLTMLAFVALHGRKPAAWR